MVTPITFSLDLEDHRADRSGPRRYPENTRKVLEFLGERGVRGTFFVVGEVAEAEPKLVQEISDHGHEIAFHSHSHRPLTKSNDRQFREDAEKGKTLLEDLVGRKVAGYRAPVFSLTPESRWAVEALWDLGFAYSSSVLGAANPLHGFPGAPATPFRWPNGLLEIPVPLGAIGPIRLPYLGGLYLRYLPRPLVRHLRAKAPQDQCAWTYCHPYDFDADEPFGRIEGAPLWASILLWLNRRGSFDKLEAIMAEGTAPPFIEQVEQGRYASVPTLDPALGDQPRQ